MQKFYIDKRRLEMQRIKKITEVVLFSGFFIGVLFSIFFVGRLGVENCYKRGGTYQTCIR